MVFWNIMSIHGPSGLAVTLVRLVQSHSTAPLRVTGRWKTVAIRLLPGFLSKESYSNHLYVYIDITHIYIDIYIYIYRERER